MWVNPMIESLSCVWSVCSWAHFVPIFEWWMHSAPSTMKVTAWRVIASLHQEVQTTNKFNTRNWRIWWLVPFPVCSLHQMSYFAVKHNFFLFDNCVPHHSACCRSLVWHFFDNSEAFLVPNILSHPSHIITEQVRWLGHNLVLPLCSPLHSKEKLYAHNTQPISCSF